MGQLRNPRHKARVSQRRSIVEIKKWGLILCMPREEGIVKNIGHDEISLGLDERAKVESVCAGLAAVTIEFRAKSSWWRSVRDRSQR